MFYLFCQFVLTKPSYDKYYLNKEEFLESISELAPDKYDLFVKLFGEMEKEQQWKNNGKIECKRHLQVYTLLNNKQKATRSTLFDLINNINLFNRQKKLYYYGH